jgi:hypothetical protein
VRQRSAGLVVEEVRQFLEADLDVFGGFVIVGKVGRVAPCVLVTSSAWGASVFDDPDHAHQQLAVLLLEPMQATGGILRKVLAGTSRRQRRVC